MVFGAMLSISLLAQQVTNVPPSAPLETPAPAAAPPPSVAPVTPPAAEVNTNAPAAKPGKKKAPKKKAKKTEAKKTAAAELKTVPLTPGPAVVSASHVNVRGQAKLNSEIVTRLTNGQPVTVLEEVVRNNSGPEEPSAWAKVLLPPGGRTWVNTSFLDTDKTVKATKLNVRSGPGENYSVLGQLQHGEAVKELATKGDWTEIEAPTNAYAFVAAQYLKQESGATPAPAEIAATPATVSEAPKIAATTTETPALTSAPTETPALTNAPTEAVAAAPAAPPPPELPPPPRVVQHEGIVRGTFSIQAPTKFELVSPETRRTIDYLYTTSPNLDLRRYKGLRIVVTGEESLEERWGNTPVLTIQKIQVLSE